MNNIVEKENIENFIYEIRGKQVMMDSDLAKLYECSNGTKDINKAVKRHINRFPDDFCFQLSREEYYEILRFQTGTLELQQGKYSKYLPTVFTEQGVYMLATILKSKVATQVSIAIMDAFVHMRHYLNYSKELLPNRVMLLEDQVNNNTKRINELFDKFNVENYKNYLFFDGQIYDVYSLLMDILNKATNEIIIIDNYAGKELLDILKNIDKKIIIISCNIDDTLKKKYEKQYSNVKFINKDIFHDRFIIIDRIKLYSCGAFFKDLGKKCFALNEIDSKVLTNNLINKILEGGI